MKVAQRRKVHYGDDRHCHGCGGKYRLAVIEVPDVGPVKVTICPHCDGRETIE